MKNTQSLIFTALCVLISACGGGGGASGPVSGGTTADLPSGFIFDYDDDGRTNLVAVDPQNPTIRHTVQSAGTYHIVDDIFTADTFDETTQSVTGARVGALLYESGGKLYKVLNTKSGAPIPIQVSSASGLATCPESWTNNTPTNLSASYVVVQTSGGDGSCGTLGDNQYLLIRLDMTSSDAPIAAPRPLNDVSDETTGAALGWLVASGGQILYYDINFQNPVALSETYVTEPKKLSNDFFAIDNKVFRFIASVGALLLVHTAPGSVTFADASTFDGSFVYFARSDAKLYRALVDGNTTATLVYGGLELNNLKRIAVSTNRVVFSNSNDSLYSVLKSGASVSATSITSSVGVFVARGTRIYFDAFDGLVYSASVSEDGTSINRLNNSFFLGVTTPTAFSLTANTNQILDKLIRLENFNGASGSLAGATLSSVRLSDGAAIADLGNLPSGNYQIAAIPNIALGDANFLQKFLSGPNPPLIGSIFFNAAKPNSLVSIN